LQHLEVEVTVKLQIYNLIW